MKIVFILSIFFMFLFGHTNTSDVNTSSISNSNPKTITAILFGDTNESSINNSNSKSDISLIIDLSQKIIPFLIVLIMINSMMSTWRTGSFSSLFEGFIAMIVLFAMNTFISNFTEETNNNSIDKNIDLSFIGIMVLIFLVGIVIFSFISKKIAEKREKELLENFERLNKEIQENILGENPNPIQESNNIKINNSKQKENIEEKKDKNEVRKIDI